MAGSVHPSFIVKDCAPGRWRLHGCHREKQNLYHDCCSHIHVSETGKTLLLLSPVRTAGQSSVRCSEIFSVSAVSLSMNCCIHPLLSSALSSENKGVFVAKSHSQPKRTRAVSCAPGISLCVNMLVFCRCLPVTG